MAPDISRWASRRALSGSLICQGLFYLLPYWNTAIASDVAVALLQISGDLEYENGAENNGTKDRRARVHW